VVNAAVTSMVTLNKSAADALRLLPRDAVHACTDITGFGLAGHASEMAAASGCTVQIEAARVPLLPGAADLVDGNVPGGGRTNAAHFGPVTRAAARLDPRVVQLMHDPQTSGGLLVAVHPAYADAATQALLASGVDCAEIGQVVAAAGSVRVELR
jgi:selenide,water dikinase